MKKLMFLLVIVLMVACEKDLPDLAALGENNDIIGTWIKRGYEGDTTFLYRAEALDTNKYGITFEEDGTFIERKNAVYLLNAPFPYDNYEGTWEVVSDSLLDITVAYWGGVMTYQIRIVSLDGAELAIRYLYSTDRVEANRFNF